MVKELFFIINYCLFRARKYYFVLLFISISGISIAQQDNCGIKITVEQNIHEVELIVENYEKCKFYLINENNELINVDDFGNNKIKGLKPGKYQCLIEGSNGCQAQTTFIVK
jgi:hypothetical protein